jgi:hypothetical protein
VLKIESETCVYCLWAKPYLYKDFGVPPKRCLLQETRLFIRDATAEGERRCVYTQETCLYEKDALGILVTVYSGCNLFLTELFVERLIC